MSFPRVACRFASRRCAVWANHSKPSQSLAPTARSLGVLHQVMRTGLMQAIESFGMDDGHCCVDRVVVASSSVVCMLRPGATCCVSCRQHASKALDASRAAPHIVRRTVLVAIRNISDLCQALVEGGQLPETVYAGLLRARPSALPAGAARRRTRPLGAGSVATDTSGLRPWPPGSNTSAARSGGRGSGRNCDTAASSVSQLHPIHGGHYLSVSAPACQRPAATSSNHGFATRVLACSCLHG